jgi:RNA polymerase sigma factor (sigma-70 family)
MASTSSAVNRRSDACFLTTHWSVVLTAGRHDTLRAQSAMAKLCQAYWYPLYAYVRHRGFSPPDAEDLTQAFFARLLAEDKLRALTREGGKFRSFLLKSLNHFLVDEWRRAKALKRGALKLISLDTLSAETRYQREPIETTTAEALFEQKWVLTLLEQVFQQLQGEYQVAGKAGWFEQLKFCLTGERSALPYTALAEKLGMSEAALKVAVHRLRQRYRELLRREVSSTVTSAQEVEEELRYLFRVLSNRATSP